MTAIINTIAVLINISILVNAYSAWTKDMGSTRLVRKFHTKVEAEFNRYSTGFTVEDHLEAQRVLSGMCLGKHTLKAKVLRRLAEMHLKASSQQQISERNASFNHHDR